jgi:hypothetical protein
MNARAEVMPNPAAAQAFLRMLDPDGEFYFRAIKPNIKPATGKSRNVTFDELLSLNLAGWGAFVVVNGGGQTGAKINKARAAYVDFDKLDDHLERLKLVPFEPSFIVESSPGKHHPYWVIDGMPVGEFTRVQMKLIALLGSDPSVKDLPRVMRLPGFMHTKDPDNLFVTRVIHESGKRYSWAEFSEMLEAIEVTAPAQPAPSAPIKRAVKPVAKGACKLLSRYASNVAGEAEGGRNNALHSNAIAAFAAIKEGRSTATESDAVAALTSAGIGAGLDVGEVQATIASALNSGVVAFAQPDLDHDLTAVDEPAAVDLPLAMQLAKGVDLTSPPGLAGRVCDHMKLTAPRRLDEAYPFAALHLMSLAGRKRKGYKDSQLKLNTLTIALSAAGKDHPQEILATLSNAVGLSRFIQGNAGSHSDIIQNLIDGHGCSLYSIDEIHSLFASMSAKNAESYDQKMSREILTMSTSRLYLFRGIEKRKNLELYARKLSESVKKRDNAESTLDEQRFDKLVKRYEEVLHNLENGWPNPFFSMMGHSVPRKLDSIANVDTIEEGLIGRCLIVRCRETREELTLNQASELDVKFSFEGCVAELERVIQSSGNIIADPDAAELMNEAVAYFDRDEIRNDESMGAVYSRAPQQILKIASILGVDGGVIRREHALYAIAMVMQTVRDIRYLLSQARAGLDGASKDEIIGHAVALILKQCRSGECRSVLAQKLGKNVGFKKLSGIEPDLLDKLLNRLQEQGRIEYNDQGRSKRYRTI